MQIVRNKKAYRGYADTTPASYSDLRSDASWQKYVDMCLRKRDAALRRLAFAPPVLSREQVPAIGTSGKMNKFWLILNEMRRGDVEYLELAGASVANVQSMISRLFNSLGWCRMRSAASADGRYLIVYRQQ